MFVKEPFRVALRKHERVRMRCIDFIQLDVRDLAAISKNVGPGYLEARLDKRPAASGAVQEFQRPAPEHKCLGFVGSLRTFLDDTCGDAKTGQLCRQGESDGTGADYKDCWLHCLLRKRGAARYLDRSNTRAERYEAWTSKKWLSYRTFLGSK